MRSSGSDRPRRQASRPRSTGAERPCVNAARRPRPGPSDPASPQTLPGARGHRGERGSTGGGPPINACNRAFPEAYRRAQRKPVAWRGREHTMLSPTDDSGARSPDSPSKCPVCQGTLSPPVSGDVHCYVYCQRCGAEFQLDDPRLAPEEQSTGLAGNGIGDLRKRAGQWHRRNGG